MGDQRTGGIRSAATWLLGRRTSSHIGVFAIVAIAWAAISFGGEPMPYSEWIRTAWPMFIPLVVAVAQALRPTALGWLTLGLPGVWFLFMSVSSLIAPQAGEAPPDVFGMVSAVVFFAGLVGLVFVALRFAWPGPVISRPS